MESHKRSRTPVALIAATGTGLIYHAAWTKLPRGAEDEIVASNQMAPFTENWHGFSEEGRGVWLGAVYIFQPFRAL